ncbi:MarR family winged helix-turn-helix transcriptional regulator [Oceanicola sp. 22II-s10i]|uniref:MarR family winged helix-turn-helix transcriptional regulator n=1 Tax=Oceanicola sp. 22II-s10i TaxID=1317116 RepID=UPI000B51F280|nr:MarR family transcriptional regulator [Oceanicola sp. 22II-s10i]
MHETRSDALFELADLVHAVARRLPAPVDLEPGPCTPIEINVMRIIGRNPGVSARRAADACGLPTSNFSRVLKALVAKGLVERRTDPNDARIAHLHATDMAMRNTARMRDAWTAVLGGAGLDRDTIVAVTTALRRIDAHLSDAPTDGAFETQQAPPDQNRHQRRTTDAG